MNDGGPAFPSACTNNSEDVRFGMSLRDYFAGQALSGYCSSPDLTNADSLKVARWAYEDSDAMILEWEKKK